MGFTTEKATASKRRGCVVMKIPFPGYYDSMYSSALDSEAEQECEHRAETDKETQPEGLQLDAHTYSELLFDCVDYRKSECALNVAYAEALDNLLTECVGFKTHITYESMSSPREYNFTTDRIFVDIPKSVVRKLWRISKADGHNALRERIAKHCTSYDGFISYYKNDLKSWLKRSVERWDHNELEILLLAVLDIKFDQQEQGGNDFRWAMYYATTEDESTFNAFQSAVDWSKFDKLCADKRGELEDALRDRGVEIPAPRCDRTPDLFSSPPTGTKTVITKR